MTKKPLSPPPDHDAGTLPGLPEMPTVARGKQEGDGPQLPAEWALGAYAGAALGRVFPLVPGDMIVGRAPDSSVALLDSEVSRHHARLRLVAGQVEVEDLDSTNGTFLNGDRITEVLLKPGQMLRFGQVELKIDDGRPASAPAPVSASAPASAPAPAAAKKNVEGTMVIPRGVSLNDLGQSGAHPTGFDTNTAFSKKTNKANTYFIIGGVIVGIIIVAILIIALKAVGSK